MVATAVGPWVLAFIIISYYTVLYSDNIINRIAQATAVGGSLSYLAIVAGSRIYDMGIVPLPENQMLIIPLIIGTLSLARAVEKYGYLSRIPTAWITGIGFGVILGAATVDADIVSQIHASLTGLTATDPRGLIEGLIVLVGVVIVMLYFLYSVKRTPYLERTWTLGRYIMMASLGAIAGEWCGGTMVWAIDPIGRFVRDFLLASVISPLFF